MNLLIREASRSRTERLSARLILRPGEILSLKPMRTLVTISCIAGRIHVTQTGDPRDYILHAGDSFRSTARGKVVVGCYKSPAAAMVEARRPLAGDHAFGSFFPIELRAL